MASIQPFPSIYSFRKVFFAFWRGVLGLLLFSRGINFIFHTHHLEELISNSRFNFSVTFLAYFICIAHLVGGAFITLGLLTRLSILFQLPILIAAVIFNFESDLFGTLTEQLLSIFVLALLIFYLVKGPGEISMDTYRKTHQL